MQIYVLRILLIWAQVNLRNIQHLIFSFITYGIKLLPLSHIVFLQKWGGEQLELFYSLGYRHWSLIVGKIFTFLFTRKLKLWLLKNRVPSKSTVLELTWKLPFWGQAFTLSQSTIQGLKWGKQPAFAASCEAWVTNTSIAIQC